MEFDVETLSPTYKLSIGIPGKSNAFEISKRLGLMDYIISHAQTLISKENVDFEDVLKTMDQDRKRIEENKLETERLKIEIERLKEELTDEKKELRKQRKRLYTKLKKKQEIF